MIWPESLPRPQLEARQLEKLRFQIGQTLRSNPFWKPRLEQAGLTDVANITLQDLSRLPTLKKGELVHDQATYPPYGSNLTQPVASYSRLHQTSGTTSGKPLRWLDTPRNWAGLMECWQQMYRMMPLRSDQRCCFPFSFGPFLGFWAGFEAVLQSGRFAVAAGGLSSEGRLKLIADNQITLLGCTPTYAVRLAEVAAQQGLDLRSLGVTTILVAGEPGANVAAVRDKLSQAWGAEIIDHWGMTEVGSLGISAQDTRDELSILESECIAEILHPDRDEPVAYGDVGELVITTLYRVDSPVFRFRTGDLVQAATSPDPAGRSLLRLKGGILGRTDDMLIIRGNNVFPTSIEAAVLEFDEVGEFRLVVQEIRGMQELTIEFETAPPVTAEAIPPLVRRLSQLMKVRFNFEATVRPLPAGTLPRSEMKSRRLVRQPAQ